MDFPLPANSTVIIFLLYYDDTEGVDNDRAGVGTGTVGGSESRKQRHVAYSNSVPMLITVGKPLFILQQGQSPFHVVLPVVCSVGGFPNDYFHRTKSWASENTNTTEIRVSAKD